LSKFQGFLLRKAIERSLRKAAPSRFAYRASNDFYTVVFESDNPAEGMLVDSITGNQISGRVWNGERYEIEAMMGLDEIDGPQLKVTRFYGYERISYEGVRDYWVSELLQIPFYYWLRTYVRQKLYEVKTRFRHDRIDVLKSLVEHHLKEAADETGILFVPEAKSIIQLITEVYGQRVVAHPSYKAESGRFRLIIDSLVETGEIVATKKHGFRLSAKALATIAEYEQVERRHKDSVVHNRRLFWLTAVLAVAAVAQVIIIISNG